MKIIQDKEHKDQYNLDFFWKHFDVMKYPESEWEQFHKKIQLNQQEREKFELYLIGNPFVESDEVSIAFR